MAISFRPSSLRAAWPGVALCLALAGYVASADARTVKICAVLPTSGPNAATGIGMMNSMDLAVNRINESGRMGDIELELVRLDDGSQPSVGIAAVLRAAADPGVMACAAHWNSPVALATRDIFHRNGLANVTPASITWSLTAEQKGDEIFRMAPPDTWQVEQAARFPVDRGHKTFFLIDDNTQYGKSLVTAMQKNASELGAEMVGSDSIAVGEKDFTAVLTRARSLKPDFIFFGGVTTESALLRQQMVKLGMDDIFYYTGSGTMSPTFVNIAGPAAEGAYAYFYGLPYAAYPGGVDFVQAYAKRGYDKPYETYGIWSYAAIEALAQAIRQAADAGELSRRTVVERLKDGTFDTVMGPVSFPRPGDIKERVTGYYTVRDGRWVMTHISEQGGTITVLDQPQPLDSAE
ncbi:branched-chain amino acid ABC transporter substrate-binding protein [Verticiella sediminum]|uniref:Branched-chain amino acid ABC transporter substrate-binding protein n=1 Tax=Verticiella sediminum TaxID=1247510 RepID=A0A556ACF9_9BURK|nr:branched-chain amino acid ABC transporter substrate-binding protein [Verticiella sediminum]TSH90569.1 branched-chain amino acid ABC transporter substrate-binding protein [Verticiella sediminum]